MATLKLNKLLTDRDVFSRMHFKQLNGLHGVYLVGR